MEELSSRISPYIQRLILAFDRAREEESVKSSSGLRVFGATSAIAFIYEKLRTAVEYKDDHLLRRNAIERILNRRFRLNGRSELSDSLVKELIRARHLKEENITKEKIEKIDHAVTKYFFLIDHFSTSSLSRNTKVNWLISIASYEIERILVPPYRGDALISAMYELVLPKVVFPKEISDEETKRMQVFIAVARALIHADQAILRYYLFVTFLPKWLEATEADLINAEKQLDYLYKKIEDQLNHSLGDRLFRLVNHYAPPFIILQDVLQQNPSRAREIFSDQVLLERSVQSACSRRYQQLGERIRRSVFRGIIYIFLTKMLLALIVEVPLDKFFFKHTSMGPLLINIIFPPIFMYAMASGTKVPAEKNTQRMVELIRQIVYGNPPYLSSETLNLTASLSKRPILTVFFQFVYLATFVFTFGSIYWLLSLLGFNWLSKGIFYFFFCAVTLFAYVIQRQAKEFMVVEEKEGILSSIADFFFLPILRTGEKLAEGLSNLNVFVFIFDIIIEAPFNTIIEVVEEWFAFVKEQKDEITLRK